MGRKRNPDLQPRTYRIRQKNYATGCYDIYERTSVYDADLGRKRHLGGRLIGRLPPGETDIEKMIPVESSSPQQTASSVTNDALAVEDFRRQACITYPLDLVLFVILVATINGHKSTYAIAAYWKAQRPAFKRYFPDFPDSDISHDTIGRLISMLGKHNAGELLRRMTEPLVGQLRNRVVAIDGQAVRAVVKTEGVSRYALNVFDTDNELCIEQVWIEAKENEITRSCEAIAALNLNGAVVTCDALNTQKKFCQQVLSQGADYCFALKRNHPGLYKELTGWFNTQKISIARCAQNVTNAHGRYEERTVEVLPASLVQLNRHLIEEWPGLEDGCFVRATTKSVNKSTGEISTDTRFFITSLAFNERYIAERTMRAIRNHWKIENTLHWRLDVTFAQDRTQCRNAEFINGKAALNKIALNCLSKIQAMEAAKTGKAAPSLPALMARFSNLEDLFGAISELYTSQSSC